MNVIGKNQGMKRNDEDESGEISIQAKSNIKDGDSLASIGKRESLKKSGKDGDQDQEASKIIGEKDQDSSSYEEKTKNIKKSKKGEKSSESGAETTFGEKNLRETQYAEISKNDKISKPEETSNVSKDSKEMAEGASSQYAEVSKNRKFKRTEQIGDAEASLKADGDSRQQESLSVSDVNPELRRSNVEISAFGQIDLTAEDSTSLADINKEAHLTKSQDSKKSTSKNLKTDSKKDSDSLSIAEKDGAFGKKFDSGEASATVEQQGEEKISKKLKQMRSKRGDSGASVSVEMDNKQ